MVKNTVRLRSLFATAIILFNNYNQFLFCTKIKKIFFFYRCENLLYWPREKLKLIGVCFVFVLLVLFWFVLFNVIRVKCTLYYPLN